MTKLDSRNCDAWRVETIIPTKHERKIYFLFSKVNIPYFINPDDNEKSPKVLGFRFGTSANEYLPA